MVVGLFDKYRNLFYIPLLIASTGSSLEAVMAGKIPESNPINAARLVPKIMFPVLKTNSKSINLVRIMAIIHTKKNPINPPIMQRIIASNKN